MSYIREKLQDNIILFRVMLAVPIAYAIHVLEESFGFPQWVNMNISVAFTTDKFRLNNLIFLIISIFLTLTVYRYPRRIMLFCLLTWVSGLFFHNALFHIGGTLYFQDFSPGLISSVIIYIPLSFLILKSILREGQLNNLAILMSFIIGGVAHYAFIIADLS